MEKLIIGIDVSLESTGVCFRKNGKCKYLVMLNQYHFSKNKKFTPDDVIGNIPVLNHINQARNLKFEFIQRVTASMPTKATDKKKGITLSEWQRIHMSNSLRYSSQIVQAIFDFIETEYSVDPSQHRDQIIVCLENYSYGSDSTGLIQMAEYTALIKQKLLNKFLLLNNLYLVSGPETKMFVGKGNYDKFDMFNHYLLNTLKDDKLINDGFYESLMKNPAMFWKGSTKKKYGKKDKKTNVKPLLSQKDINIVASPVNDVIDSYFIALFTEKILLAQ